LQSRFLRAVTDPDLIRKILDHVHSRAPTRQPARLRSPIPDFPKPPATRPATAPFSVSDSLDSSVRRNDQRRERNSGRKTVPAVAQYFPILK